MAPPISSILIRAPSWIGDSIMTLPALRELRRMFPEARLTMSVKPLVKDVFEGFDAVDDVRVYQREGAAGLVALPTAARNLSRQGFDAAILLQNAFEAAVLPFLARVPVRAGFGTEGRGFLLTDSVRLPARVRSFHLMQYYLYLVAEIEKRFFGTSGVEMSRPRYELEASDEFRTRARSLLEENGAYSGKSLVAITPGATNSRAKRWKPERFAALANRLMGARDCTVVFVGGKAEVGIGREIIAQMSATPVFLTGKTSVGELAGVLSLCDLVVSNDTGPAYMAAALMRPTLTIFGPTDPNLICPTSRTAYSISVPVECAPCMLRDCPIDHQCMTGITVDRVYEKATELLEKYGSPSPS